ncbi:hypothetical protein G7077_00615 [Sphingomonas piscis]|uniref:Uncharacterized protein n=1 Tax=Sphingomonas piscis TaxID=2714943 RepID=A0A6G7YLM4_9SPHN|nr:hypothetical protein [Sphingomonas piscis]QIK77643.1 hypothetical protein G7077_00615 [Sphingomonas piscis]
MTQSTSTLLSILFGLGVFAVVVAVGWRSVQNRRILRLAGANGQETIIVAGEGDKISSVETSTETVAVERAAEPVSGAQPALDADAAVAGQERLARVVSATK